MAFVTLLAYFGRDGYVDAKGDDVSFLDALYYATVSITTTGYGDVRPESDAARLVTSLLVTPARILFLIVLVGTTLEVLAERTRQGIRVDLWRRGLSRHTVVCGFGTKGRSAVDTLLAHGASRDSIVVIDDSPGARSDASSLGLSSIAGSATRADVLHCAGIERAGHVIVAPHDDAVAVLITLTARELNPTADIVAAVRESENAHLLRQSGANSVILTSSSAGRLMGIATQTPRLVDVLEDLLAVGTGLDLAERPVRAEEVGPLARLEVVNPVLAVVRDDRVLPFDDPAAAELRPGDRIIFVRSRADADA